MTPYNKGNKINSQILKISKALRVGIFVRNLTIAFSKWVETYVNYLKHPILPNKQHSWQKHAGQLVLCKISLHAMFYLLIVNDAL